MEKQLYKRSLYFDNVKVILIFFVILGHIVQSFITDNILYKSTHAIIYSFHMPLFIFVSGYFSKDTDKVRNNAFFHFIFPYLIFNTLYHVLVDGTMYVNIFKPVYIYWFLLSMFLWRVLLKDVVKIKYYVFISILLGLYSGIFRDIDTNLSLSRTLAFFAFFLLGYKCNEDWIYKIKKVPRSLSLIILAVLSLLVVLLIVNDILPQSMLFFDRSYYDAGVSLQEGLLLRALQYLFAIGLGFCVLNLIPQRKLFFTEYGARTMVIFIGHAYLVYITSKIYFFEYVNPFLGVIMFAVISFFIIILLGNKFVFNCYNIILNFLKNIVLQKRSS